MCQTLISHYHRYRNVCNPFRTVFSAFLLPPPFSTLPVIGPRCNAVHKVRCIATGGVAWSLCLFFKYKHTNVKAVVRALTDMAA